VVLIGGDPGIGKSTLLLQALGAIAGRTPRLYVTGEESLARSRRVHRLGLSLDRLDALADTGVERIPSAIAQASPKS
jgi:DNA repair protein RadA/Sms